METIDLIIKSATSFYNNMKTDKYGRYRSWEHCYKNFNDARKDSSPDYDYLSLQLAFYLASWGMYRGSSFLLQKDYRVHIPVVKELMESKYDCLSGINCKNLRNKDNQKTLIEIDDFTNKYYCDVRKSVKEREVISETSQTLITKVLMETLGCVPAYDRYFIEGIKDQNISTGNYNINSLLKLVDF